MKKIIIIGLAVLFTLLILIIMKKKANAATEVVYNAGGNPAPANSKLKLLAKQVLRKDKQGDGSYHSSRTGHTHEGIDLVAGVGENVFTSVAGTVKKIGLAYENDNRFNSYHIDLDNGLTLKLLYVNPYFKLGNRVEAGQIIGKAQNIAGKYGGGMINHMHVELLENGVHIDPTNYLL